jgi:uncharacterized small protein (DUF1192 family)
MSKENERQVIRIELTQDQKDRLKAQTGKNADVIELTVQELEARIAPVLGWNNHNETLLVD